MFGARKKIYNTYIYIYTHENVGHIVKETRLYCDRCEKIEVYEKDRENFSKFQ